MLHKKMCKHSNTVCKLPTTNSKQRTAVWFVSVCTDYEGGIGKEGTNCSQVHLRL